MLHECEGRLEIRPWGCDMAQSGQYVQVIPAGSGARRTVLFPSTEEQLIAVASGLPAPARLRNQTSPAESLRDLRWLLAALVFLALFLVSLRAVGAV